MKRLLATALVLFAALALLGAGYARWLDTLTIGGTVNTGELSWSFVTSWVMDTTPPPWFGGTATPVDWTCGKGFTNPRPRPGTKNVGWGESELVDTNGDGKYDTVRVQMRNVYPSYFNSVNVSTENEGTIPLVFDSVVINGNVIRKRPYPVVELDLSGDGRNDVEILWTDNLGAQMHPGDALEKTFWFHVLKDAPQGAQMTFDIQLKAVQWNEYVRP